MILIEKYQSEKIYTVVHFEGKSKNYLIKRFTFEHTPPGKETSIISEEQGSKLTFISGALQPMAKIDQLKGKIQTPETIEINLAELIDVKGMKAMGNRVSQHTVRSVVLLVPPETEQKEMAEEEAEQTQAKADAEEIVLPGEIKVEPVNLQAKAVENRKRENCRASKSKKPGAAKS